MITEAPSDRIQVMSQPQPDLSQELEQEHLSERLDLLRSLVELTKELADYLETGASAETLKEANHAIDEARRMAIAIANLR